jgi:hypothetical protein
MDEKFIQALGGSVDAGFVSLLRQSSKEREKAKTSYVKVKQTKSRRRKLAKGGALKAGSRSLRGGKSPIKGGELTWIEHVRLTAGANMCWRDAMVQASKTWRR